ncbi:TetR family transcriptional regulator [Halobacillus litoralis]|uniref:TetR family transcriptional regulator n=1 Tax=Halobacillus litoralis TaxID=45668 RepID=A0A845E496_9BACI|nr:MULTISPECIES: TetR/AcrR family transcriptional regulator [Halobacillus]MCA1021367.1 TetR/AcrR family transcriptional regulator [Halobacillus litoralis]MYL21057.1 TetR family transcriptional regulator [Halobacillus litoralis]MYL31405.1 TetR family transcriptional regulator [Halobacillus halophilus]MYL38440.1 TetR family transcriptional regulator [Halobacillus litoralis]
MDQKKLNIIETSIKLFAKKGFSSTSVQEIAKAANISKGAFYLHFDTKDDLLYELFEHYWRRMQKRINEVSSTPMTPKEKFIHQLKVSMEEVADHREFIIMQIREQVIPFNDMIENLIRRMRYHSVMFYRNHILAIYGSEAEPFAWEASLTVQSLFKTYIDLMIMDNMEFSLLKVAESIANKMDAVMEGYKSGHDCPVITNEVISRVIPENFQLNQMKDIMTQLQEIYDQENDVDLKDTADLLLQELTSKAPRPAVIKGMVFNLERYDEYIDLSSQIRAHYM